MLTLRMVARFDRKVGVDVDDNVDVKVYGDVAGDMDAGVDVATDADVV